MNILEGPPEYRGRIVVPTVTDVVAFAPNDAYTKAYKQLKDLKRLVDMALGLFDSQPLVELSADERTKYANMFKDATFVLGGRFEIRDLDSKTIDT